MKILSSRLTINQLMLSNLYLGDNFSLINIKIKPFLLGYKSGYHIINLSFTHVQLKLLLKVVMNLIINRQKILIVKELDFYNFSKILRHKNLFYHDRKWIGGFLTNFRAVRRNKSVIKTKLSYSNDLTSLRYMPSLLCIFDTKISKWPLMEAYNLEIPISGILNSSSNLIELINYPVIGNNKSFESIYLYIALIKNAVRLGKQKERLKILRIL